MNAVLQQLGSSFRFRLTLFLALVMGVLIWSYGYAVSLKLEREAVRRAEGRLVQVAARWVPLLPGPGAGRGEPAFGRRERGIVLGVWEAETGWHPVFGTWPEALVARSVDWLQRAGGELERLSPPPSSGRSAGGPAGPPPPFPGRRWGGEGLPRAELRKLHLQEINVEGDPWTLLTARLEEGERFAVLAYNLADERALARDMTRVQTLFLPIVMGVVLVVGWLFATRALRPVKELAAKMAQLTGRNFEARLAESGAASEFRDLIRVFNAMVERLERSFQQASRFSADAAHELKTPLTVLQGEIEAALAEAPAGSAGQQQLNSMLEEVQRLKRMTERLLLLARADAGRLLGRQSEVDLEALVQDGLEAVEAIAPNLLVTLEMSPVSVFGDPILLQQAVTNLFSNAVKYNLSEGWLRIRLGVVENGEGRRVELDVVNASEAIPAAAQAQLFERFFRGDAARSRMVDGLGLGLSLTREIARAHGGDLELISSDANGTFFRLTLPLAS